MPYTEAQKRANTKWRANNVEYKIKSVHYVTRYRLKWTSYLKEATRLRRIEFM